MPDPITSSITILVAGDNALSAENAGNSGATLVSASGQLVAAIGSITPAGSIATAPGAAAVTLMKITLDLQSGAGASYGDIASVIGNLLSLTGGVIAFVPGLQAPGIGLTILGNVANGVGLYSDRQQIIGAFQNLWNSMQSGQSVSTGAPALQEIQGTLTSQSWFESGERSALGNATGQIASDGIILVPQTDSSGNIVNYVPEQPIAPPQDLGGGLTRYSFAGGTTVDVQSPTDPSANSGVIANWTIPQLNGIATQLSIDTQMGGSVLSVTDASGNVVEKFNDVVTQVNGIVSHTYSTMTSGGQTNEQTQVTSNGDSTNTQSTVFNGDGTVSYTENILYSNGIISRDEIDANINSSLSVFGDGVVLNGLGGNDVSILGNANVLNLSNSSIRFSSGVTGEVAGTGNQVSLGKANDISISGSSNAISSTGDASGSTITLNGTGNSADTLNLFGATGITVLLGDSTTAVNLVATSATVTSRSGGGVVNGSGGDRLNISGADITVNGNGGQYVFSGTGDLANISNATVAFSADSQATLVGTRNSFSLGLDSSLTLEVTGATSPTTVITTDSQGNATFTSSGGSVLFGPVGQEITQASNGALSVAVGATGMVQVFLPTGESAGSPIQFSGIESMTLNTDGGYSMVDQSGNAYTLQPVSGSSNYVLENATTGTMNVTLDTGSVTGISLGQALSIQTSSGGTLALPAAGGAGSLALSNLGNVSLDAGSAIAISANAIDVSVPGSGTTSEYAFASDGTVSSISTYDDSSAQHVPAVVTSFNSDGVATQQLTNNASGGSQVVLLNAADPSAGFISQTQYFAGANGTGSLISQATNFTNGLSEIDEYNPAPGTVLTRTQYSGVDGSGEVLSQTTNFLDGTSTVTTYATSSSASSGLSSSGITSQTVTYSGWDGSGDAINTTYNSTTNSTISGANIGSALGSKIGQLLGGNSAIESIGLSSVLGTLGKDVGAIVDSSGAGVGDLSQTVSQLADSALPSIATAGAGAVGAYLTGELVKDLGVTGLPAQVIDTGAGFAVGTIASNLTSEALGDTSVAWDSGLTIANFADVFAGFAGAEIASLVASWDTPEEEDLAAVGATVGGALGSVLGPVGTFIGGFLGDMFGGLIGGLFGGPPNPWTGGTIIVATNSMNPFAYVQTLSHDNGPDAYLASIGNAISTELNGIVSTVGATVANAQSLNRALFLNAQVPQRNIRVIEKGQATNFNISDASHYVDYVVFDQLSQIAFNGGDVFVERAINATVQQWQAFGSTITLNTLLGNIQVAKDYEKYLQNEATINGLIAKNPTSDFSAGWIIELQQAVALNLANGVTQPGFSSKYGTLDYYGEVFNYGMDAGRIAATIESFRNGANSTPNTSEAGLARDLGLPVPGNWYPNLGTENKIKIDGSGMLLDLQESGLPLIVNGDQFQLKIAGNSNNVTMNGQTEFLSIQGDGSSIIENGDFDSVSIFGNGNSAVVNGRQATILLSGGGNSLTNANGSANVADNSNVTINGLQESVSVWNHSTLLVNGGQMNVSVNGSGSSVTLNGDNEQVQLIGDGDSLINNGQGDTVTVTGTNASLTQGAGSVNVADWVTLSANGEYFGVQAGNNDRLTVGGQYIGVTLSGQADVVTTNGMSMKISGDTFDSSLTSNGNNNSIVVSGNANTVTGNGGGGYVTASGDDNNLISNGQSFTLEAIGSGNSLTENGDQGFMSANGNGNVVHANGQQITVAMAGGNSNVTIGNGKVSYATGATGVLNGIADAISLTSASDLTVNGGSMHVSLNGTLDNVTANGDSNIINIRGGNDTLTANGSGVTIGASGNADGMTLNGNRDSLSISGDGSAFWINGQQNVATFGGTNNTVHSSGLSATVLDSSSAEFDGGGNSVTLSNNDTVTLNGSGYVVNETDTNSAATINGDYENATTGGNGNSLVINGNSSNVVLSGESNAVTISGLAASIAASGVEQTITDNQGNIAVAAGSQVNLVGNGSIATLGNADSLTVEGSNNWVNATSDDSVTMTGTGNGIGGLAVGITAILAGDGQFAALDGDTIRIEGGIHANVSGSGNAIRADQGAVVTVDGTSNALQMTGGTLVLADQTAETGSDPETGSSRSGFSVDGFDYTSYKAGEFSSAAGQTSMQSLADTGANSVSLVVTQYVNNITDTDIEPAAATESDASLEQAIANAKAAGLSVTLKPHLDVADGTWRAYLAPSNVAHFFANYQAMIVHYAEIAQATGAGMLVIGTEMESLSGSAYEPYWDALISAVRQVYSGKLTYASGWNETANVSFWSKLDVIGADAYIPVTSHIDPTLQQLETGWTTVSSDPAAASAMENMSPLAFYQGISAEYDKSVLFTEIGYQSVNDTNQLEGAFGTSNWVDFQQQSRALQAFFSTFSQNGGNWFEGAYLWNWDANPADVGANDFTVQGKPALNIVDFWYGKQTGSALGTATPNSLNGDSDMITVGSGDALNVTGNDNQISLGSNAAVVVNGQGNTVAVTGGNNVIETSGATMISLSRDGTTVITSGDGDTIVAGGARDGLAINSNGSTVTLAGTADALTLSGNGSTINVVGAADTLSVAGTGNTVNVSGNSAVIQTNGANSIELVGNGSSAAVEGGSDTIDVSGVGDSISVASSGATIVVGDVGSTIALDSGNYQIATGNGNNSITAGDGSNVISVGAGTNSISLGNGNNAVTLGDGSDTVTLGSGIDAITLGNGNDTLTLGGNDALAVDVAAGDSTKAAAALILDGSSASSQSNELIFGRADSDQVWFSRSNNDLLVSVIGTSSQIDIAGWFDGNTTSIQSFAAADGKVLTGNDVDALVSAMASFGPPAAGSTTLPDSYQNQLHPVIAANWH